MMGRVFAQNEWSNSDQQVVRAERELCIGKKVHITAVEDRDDSPRHSFINPRPCDGSCKPQIIKLSRRGTAKVLHVMRELKAAQTRIASLLQKIDISATIP